MVSAPPPSPQDWRASGRLVERPKVRFVWFGVLFLVGLFLAGMALDVNGTGDAGTARLIGGVGALCVGVALPALRWSIVADEKGVTITNYGRPRTIVWADLDEVLLEAVQANIEVGFHYLVLVAAGGKRVRAAAPTGMNKPGGKMRRLQEDLLAMRDHYAPVRE